jgi:O-antigen/teichoic acid export membrane protein
VTEVVAEPPKRTALSFLIRNALTLVSTSFLTSGLGFIYWAAAARLYDPTIVGESATAIAAMNLLSPVAMLGLGTLLVSELPKRTERRGETVVAAAAISGTAGAVLALVAALLLPSQFLGLPGIGSEWGASALFVVGVATQVVGLVFDSALLSTWGGGLQLGRNAVFSIVKLGAVIGLALALSSTTSLSVFASWVIGNVVSFVTTALWMSRTHTFAWSRLVPRRGVLAGRGRSAAAHHALNLALSIPYFAMPIVANVTMTSQQAGYLYATWSVAAFVFVLPIALSTALFASGSAFTEDVLPQFRLSLRYSLLACVGAAVVAILLGDFVLRVFGKEYADQGHIALILLSVAGVGLVIKDHHVALSRLTGRVSREARVVWVLTVLELVGASVGGLLNDIEGLAAGWLLVVMLEIAVYGPMVLRTYRGRLESGPDDESSRSASAKDADLSGSPSIPL